MNPQEGLRVILYIIIHIYLHTYFTCIVDELCGKSAKVLINCTYIIVDDHSLYSTFAFFNYYCLYHTRGLQVTVMIKSPELRRVRENMV